MKAFLSHSSANKDYVRKVFDYLTAGRANYDSVTFESFQRSHEAIQNALRDSDLFVYFASPQSIQSEWIKEEVRTACDPSTIGKMLDRVVVLLGVDRSSLPQELKQATAISYSDPDLVARKIESLLIEMHARIIRSRPFIGREDDLKALGAGLVPVGTKTPEFLVVSGLSGIGRKSLVYRAIRDNFPFIGQTLRVIPISKGAGLPDLYFAIRSSIKKGTVDEYMKQIEAFSILDEKAQSAALAELVSEAVSERDPLILDDAAWLLTDGGDLADWMRAVLEALPSKPFPQVILVSTRALSPSGRSELNGRYFTYVLHSLSKSNTSRLLWLTLQHSGASVDPTTLTALTEVVDGHPEQVVRAANLISGGQALGGDLRTRQVIEALTRSAENLVSLADLSHDQYLAIQLFNEFEYMSLEDLSTAYSDPVSFEESMFRLLDLCFVEHVGDFLRLAPSISRALVRISEKRVEDDVFVAARRAIAERLNKIGGDDLVEFEVLENSVAAWVRSSQVEPPLKSARMLLPASLLRCAQRSYDSRDWAGAAEFSSRALDGSWKLTPEAALDASRLRGLSLARLGDDLPFEQLLEEMKRADQFHDMRKSADRMINFLLGFKSRLDGDYTAARGHLEKVLQSDKRPNFSILREYSDVLVKLGDLDLAMEYSRKALDMAASNPFVIAMVIDILDKKISRDGETASIAKERRELFGRLRRADDVQRTSFSMLREARQFARMKDYDRALLLLDQTEVDRDSDPIVVALERARVLLMKGNFDAAYRSADEAWKKASSTLGRRAFDFASELDEIKVRARAEQGQIAEARRLLELAKRIDPRTRDDLVRLIGFAEAR